MSSWGAGTKQHAFWGEERGRVFFAGPLREFIPRISRDHQGEVVRCAGLGSQVGKDGFPVEAQGFHRGVDPAPVPGQTRV